MIITVFRKCLTEGCNGEVKLRVKSGDFYSSQHNEEFGIKVYENGLCKLCGHIDTRHDTKLTDDEIDELLDI